MALPITERTQLERPSLAQKPHLRFVDSTHSEPLQDLQRQIFYRAVRIVSQQARRQLILTFPQSTEAISHQHLAHKGVSDNITSKGSEAWRLLRTHFEGIVTSHASSKRGHETHQLTSQGLILRKTAEIAEEFSHKYNVSLDIFGQRNNDGALSEAVRSEMLFALALHEAQDAQGLSQLLHCDASTFSRIFPAFEEAGLITVSRQSKNTNHPVTLTEAGWVVVKELLLPIAQLTEFPTEIVAELKATIQEHQTRNLVAFIIDDSHQRELRQNAWADLLKEKRNYLNKIIWKRMKQFPYAKWEEIESYALEGFMGAVLNFNLSSPVPFDAFVFIWINNKMNNYTDHLKVEARRAERVRIASLEEMAELHPNENMQASELPCLADDSFNPNNIVGEGPERIRQILLDAGFNQQDVDIFIRKYGKKESFNNMDDTPWTEKTKRKHVAALIASIKGNNQVTRRLIYGE